MGSFVVKRIASAVVTLFVVATITFFLMNIIPGGPFNTERATAKVVAQMEKKYGLDKPLIEQYGIYMGRLLHLDLGDSYKRPGFTVNEIIGEKFPVSAKLGLVAVVCAVAVGIPLGSVAALKRNSVTDRIIMFVATLGIAVPSFVMATLLLITFGVNLKWLPIMGLDTPAHYVMPAVSLAFYPMCYIARLMRSSMLDVINQDYIKTARAKGLSENRVLFKHALRNSIIPVITYLGPLTAYTLTGGFVVEKIFSIPGLGKFFIESIKNRDYPLIMGTTIFLASLIILANFLVDIVYGLIDPRIQYE